MSLIRLDNVSKFYKSGDGVSVGMRKVSTNFNYGEFVAVTGESGSGKSTLLNVISGLDTYEDGELYIENEETSHFTNKEWELYRSRYIGFIFQSYNIIDSFTVYQNVLLALEIQNYPKELRKKRALELIDKVGLSSHVHHKAAKLSGGQKQRTVIARALAKDCPIIVADEPTGNLDSAASKQIIELLHEISKDKLVVIVTHEFDQVKEYATRRIKMHDGEIVEDKILQKVEVNQTAEKPIQKGMSFSSILRFAIRNIFATPRRTFFILLFQIIIMSIFIFGYSALMTSARNQDQFGSPSYNDGNYFGFNTKNTSDNRFFILKKDGSNLTQTDYDTLNSLSGGDYYLYQDLTFIEKENFGSLTLENDYTSFYFDSQSPMDSSYAIQSMPQFLVEGRLPEADNEVVLSNQFLSIYEGKKLMIRADKDVIQDIGFVRNNNLITIDYVEGIVNEYIIYLKFSDNSIAHFRTWQQTLNLSNYLENTDQITEINIEVSIFIEQFFEFNIVGIYNDNFRQAIYFYHEFLVPEALGQKAFMLTAKNNVDAERIFSNIDQSVYRILYPSLNTGVQISLISTVLFILSAFYFALIFFLALFLYFILFTFIKNIMNARKKDFAIYRSIGTNQSRLGWLVIFEQLFIMLIAFVFTMTLITIIRYFDYSFNLIFAQLVLLDYFVLFFLFTYLTLWLARRFNKKTFKFSIIENITESKEESL